MTDCIPPLAGLEMDGVLGCSVDILCIARWLVCRKRDGNVLVVVMTMVVEVGMDYLRLYRRRIRTLLNKG